MSDLKFCSRCGVVISNLVTGDYYSHISIKYCTKCAEVVEREKTAARVKALRQRKRTKDKTRDEQLELYKEENNLLRQNIIALRESLEQLQAQYNSMLR